MGNAVGIAQMLQLGAAQYAESLQQYQDISHVNHPEAHTLAASGEPVACLQQFRTCLRLTGNFLPCTV